MPESLHSIGGLLTRDSPTPRPSTLSCNELSDALGIDAPHPRGATCSAIRSLPKCSANGASMSEIAKILRHQSERSTAIYAKVDLAALRSIAHPWPGGCGMSELRKNPSAAIWLCGERWALSLRRRVTSCIGSSISLTSKGRHLSRAIWPLRWAMASPHGQPAQCGRRFACSPHVLRSIERNADSRTENPAARITA